MFVTARNKNYSEHTNGLTYDYLACIKFYLNLWRMEKYFFVEFKELVQVGVKFIYKFLPPKSVLIKLVYFVLH